MRTVSVSEAKSRLSELLRQVQAGEEVLILDRGMPVARLSPALGPGGLLRLERQGLLRRGKGNPHLEDLPLPTPKESVLRALLEEREEG
ncbi:type II toxin-antitoxin system Phd/YefM family antitoxin [Thermus sp.]|uniref:type II toxin-antitoxin system Phd/YefM family antitoxin n=1 Tax=Thermus sp. TaxID=275 RepID=UPI003D149A3C